MTAPLAGLIVLDLTHVLAGPYATMQLAELGATIIKIERPGIGDDTRAFPPFVDGQSAYFAGINRGKHSIALDLTSDADRAVFDRLLARADVLVENYRPGALERLGYGWDDLHPRFPRLVYGAVSGFGHTGPDKAEPAYDIVVQARSGIMSITGEAGREPVRVGASIGDIAAGMFLVQGILAALLSRQTTGQGQKIDISMLDGQLALLEHAIAITSATGTPPGRTGARHPTITPFETYHAEDGLFVIAAGNDALFVRLCACLDRPDLARDPRFLTNATRCQNARLLKREIELMTLHAPAETWIAKLRAAGIPTGHIQDVAQAMQDPQLLARNMIVTLAAEDGRPAIAAAGNPVKMSDLPDGSTRPGAPRLDGDRDAILAWLEGATLP